MSDCYDRDGNQVTMDAWSKLNAGWDYSRIAETEIHGLRVSTVWLGLNHNFGAGPPLIFETMVFGDEIEGKEGWLHHDLPEFTGRYTTEDEARRGHALVVEEIRQMFTQVSSGLEGGK